jgi:hypothetical protein
MKRFIVFSTLLSMVMVFSIGCDKKAETKPAAPATPAAAPADAPKGDEAPK